MSRIIPFLLLLLTFGSAAQAGEIFEAAPDEVWAGERYVFYSHGLIVEGDDPTPTHSRWGVYDFPGIKNALAQSGLNVIARQRPVNTNPHEYAKALSLEVRTLIEAGVRPDDITIMGFSRGGRITIYAAHELVSTPVNVVILAGCGQWVGTETDVQLSGAVLSIYETSDSVGSCEALRDRSDAIALFEELAISTGKEHGTFYSPRSEWMNPAVAWIESRSSTRQGVSAP